MTGAKRRASPKMPMEFAQDTRGATAMIFAIALPVLVGMTALAVDVGVWTVQKRQAQGAADQAAYSAAVAFHANSNEDRAEAEARVITAGMGFADGVNGVTVEVSNPPVAGRFAGTQGYWEVTVRKPQSLGLASIFLGSAPIATARAVAGGGAAGNSACIISLATSGTGLSMSGNSDIVNPACNVYVNSSASNAVNCSGNGEINAFVHVVGQVNESGNCRGKVPQKNEGASAIQNPYADVTASAPSGSCSSQSGASTLNPGYYCSLNKSGNGTLTLNPGVYYVANTFSISGNGTLNGTGGVTIVMLSGNAPALSGNGDININAPTSGPYAGVAMMGMGTSSMNFSGNGETRINGAIYFPNSSMSLTGNFFNSNYCTQVVGRTITLSGNANMKAENCPAGIRPVGGSNMALALVE